MDPERVLGHWFGELDEEGLSTPAQQQRWFTKDDAFDAELREQFLAEHQAVRSGQRDHWLIDPRGRLAYVVVLDQFSRNMFRGTKEMFASDKLALKAAREGVERGADRALKLAERQFLYMPFMHSEALEDQERAVALFTALRDDLTGRARENVENAVRYTIMHRDIVARFGRFPHRNELLGRESTPEELEFLTQPNSSF